MRNRVNSFELLLFVIKDIFVCSFSLLHYLFGLLQEIWETLTSHVRMVLVVVAKVKARVAVSVATLPMST
jgi:hypothetical protein